MGDLVVSPVQTGSPEHTTVLGAVRRLVGEPTLRPEAVTVYPLGTANPPVLVAPFEGAAGAARASGVEGASTTVLSLLDVARMGGGNADLDAVVRSGLAFSAAGMVFPSGPVRAGPLCGSDLLLCEVLVGRGLALPISAFVPGQTPRLPDGFHSWALVQDEVLEAGAPVFPQYLIHEPERVAVRYYIRIARGESVPAQPLLRGQDGSYARACPEHPDQPLSFWCTVCGKSLCVYCKMVGDHAHEANAEHALTPLATVAAGAVAKVEQGLGAEPEVRRRMDAIQVSLAGLDGARREVDAAAAAARDALTAKYEAAMAQVDAVTDFHHQVLLSDTVELRRQASVLDSLGGIESEFVRGLDGASLISAVVASRTEASRFIAETSVRLGEWNPALEVRGDLVVTSGLPPVSSTASAAGDGEQGGVGTFPHLAAAQAGRLSSSSGSNLLWTQVLTMPPSELLPAKPTSTPLATLGAAEQAGPTSPVPLPPPSSSSLSSGKRGRRRRRSRKHSSRKHSQYGHRSPAMATTADSGVRKYRRRGVRRLVRLVVQDEFALAHAVGRTLSSGSQTHNGTRAGAANAVAATFGSLRETAYDLVQVATAEGLGLNLVLSLLRAQVADGVAERGMMDADVVSSLFNGSSLASHVMVAYAQMVGLAFVRGALAPFFEAAESLGLAGTESMHRQARLEGLATGAIDALLGSTGALPLQFGAIVGALYAATSSGALADAGVKAVGSFIVLRVFCPALAQPDLYGLGTPEHVTSSELHAVSSVLQHLVSGVAYEPSSELAILNDYLRRTYPRVRDWLVGLGKAHASGRGVGLEYPATHVSAADLSQSIMALAAVLVEVEPALPVQLKSIRLGPGEPAPDDPSSLTLATVLNTVAPHKS